MSVKNTIIDGHIVEINNSICIVLPMIVNKMYPFCIFKLLVEKCVNLKVLKFNL